MTAHGKDLLMTRLHVRERGIGSISMNKRCKYKYRDNRWATARCRIVLKPKEGGRNGCSRI
jgi:hypothetical protein